MSHGWFAIWFAKLVTTDVRLALFGTSLKRKSSRFLCKATARLAPPPPTTTQTSRLWNGGAIGFCAYWSNRDPPGAIPQLYPGGTDGEEARHGENEHRALDVFF